MKQRLVICNDEVTDSRARVTTMLVSVDHIDTDVISIYGVGNTTPFFRRMKTSGRFSSLWLFSAPLRGPIPLPGLSRDINSLLIYLLTYAYFLVDAELQITRLRSSTCK